MDADSRDLGPGFANYRDRDLAWIRERLDYANRAYQYRLLRQADIKALERHLGVPAVLTLPCPLCGKPVLNDGTFEACADCPEPR